MAACTASAGHLATATSAGEAAVIASVQNPAQNPWIGATDAVVEGTFAWQTGEPFGFAAYAPGEPDDGGGTEDCLHLASSPDAGTWNDANCDGSSTTGRICELEPIACGDGVVQGGESCDDHNRTSNDGCDSTCHLETVFFSEYIEGGPSNSFSQAVEIYNPLGVPRTIFCLLRVYGANNMFVFNQTPVSATIPAHGTHTVCNPGFNAAFVGACNQTFAGINFSGDDLVELNCGGVTVDSIGQLGFIQNGTQSWGAGLTSTQNHTLRRTCGVAQGDTAMSDVYDPSLEWNGFATDTFDGLGSHSCP